MGEKKERRGNAERTTENMDSGKQGRENEGVSNLISVASFSPVAAGAPAFLGVRFGRLNSTLTPESNHCKTHKGPMNTAGEAFEEAVAHSRWNVKDICGLAVLVSWSALFLHRLAEWAHLGFRVIGK
jgi:hypothetical protein